jgi:hypothetical protein
MSGDMSKQMDDVELVNVASIEPVIADAEDGRRYAYLKITTPSGESVNLLVPSAKAACQFSAALLDMSDHLE